MDNAQKAIMIGVGLFVTILIIAAVMLIVTPAIDMIKRATGQVTNLSDALQAQLTAEYDGTTVTGAQAKAAIKMYYTDENMILEIQATKGAKYLDYGKVRGNGTTSIDKALTYDSSNVKSTIGTLDDSSDTTNYVPSSAKYKAELIRSTSGDVVMGIIFTRAN